MLSSCVRAWSRAWLISSEFFCEQFEHVQLSVLVCVRAAQFIHIFSITVVIIRASKRARTYLPPRVIDRAGELAGYCVMSTLPYLPVMVFLCDREDSTVIE